jgi:integrase
MEGSVYLPRKKKPVKNINGMGSTRKLDNGKWEYRFTMPDRKPDGSPDVRSRTGDTAQDAVKRGQAVIAEYNMKPEAKIKASDMTMAIWAERWFKQHEKEIRKSSLTCDKNTKRHIVNELGPMLLQDIKPTHIKAVLQKKVDAGKSQSLVSKIRGMLYQMLNDAAIDDIIVRNPVTLIKQKRKAAKQKSSTAKRDAFKPEEVKLIIAAQDGTWISNSIMLDLFSGIREGEMLALEKPHVDSAGRFVDIVQSLNIEEGKSVLGEVKTDSALRHVPIARIAHASVAALYEQAVDDVLFPGRKPARFYGGSGYRKAYYKFIKAIQGVRPLSPYNCRHTYGTMLAAADVPPAKIQYIMGHSDYRTTANVYTHIAAWMAPEAVALLKLWGVGDFSNEDKDAPLGMVGDSKTDVPEKEQRKTTEPA